MDFVFDENEIPRWWFGNNPLLTHAANGLHLVFPEGERFFIRSVARYIDRIDDPELKERATAFFQQEASHGREHTHSFEMLERQGYDVTKYLEWFEKRAVPAIEGRSPGKLCLSVTAALEHLTATLGENALVDDFIERAHPQMIELLRWHACEEIEHKSVAYDVLQIVDDGYALRVSGMVLGLALLMFFWTLGARKLIAQENLSKEDVKKYREQLAPRKGFRRKIFKKAFLEYVKPKFHPDQNDNYHLAHEYLARIGRLAA